MKYKALLIDVDGTIIDNQAHKKLPSTKVQSALQEASKIVSVNFVTGRPLRDMQEILDQLEIKGIAVVNGGAKIIDTLTGEVIQEYVISPNDIAKVGRLLRNLEISCSVRTDERNIPFSEWDNSAVAIDVTVKAITKNIASIAIDSLSSIPTINSYLINSYKDNLFDIHITHTKATKQAGVMMIAEKLKIEPSEIIGIGDGYNDFPLLMACGLKVAMGNAVDELKEIADYIAPSVTEDGVAKVIERYIL